MSCWFGVSPTPLTIAVLLGQRDLLAERVADARLLDRVAMQFGDVLGDALACGVVPGSVADPVARIHGAGALRAQIGVPRDAAASCGSAKRLAIGISTGDSAEVGAVALADAGDEEGHRLRRRRRLLCPDARTEQPQRPQGTDHDRCRSSHTQNFHKGLQCGRL